MTKQERQAIAAKKWYEKNKEKIAEKRKGKRQEASKAYYLKNKEKAKKQAREWAIANPEKCKLILEKSRKNFPERNLYNKAKGRCKLSGLSFDITVEDIVIPEYCPLLGIKLDSWGEKDACPSLDRKNNTLGYTKDNIWVISFLANRMKNTSTKEQLITFAENVLKLHRDI